MRPASFALSLIVAGSLGCQGVIAQVGNARGDVDLVLNDLTKKYFQDRRYERVEGSPFMIEDWSTGALELKNGKRYEALRMKFDLVSREVIFLSGQNTELLAPSESVRLFELSNGVEKLIFKSGYPAIEKQTANSFYQVLVDDTLSLLKFQQKTIIQRDDFEKKKVFMLYEDYYICHENKLWPVRNKGSLAKVLPSRSRELESFLDENKLKTKNETDLRKVVGFMNSLKLN